MPNDIDELLTRGIAEVLVEKDLRAKLSSGRKLRKFQDLGHEVVLIVGDWTAQIGDPSGLDETRPRLTREVVRENATTYMEQFFKMVDRAKTEVRWQSEWFGTFDLERALDLAGRFTLAQMLAHETFRKRYEAGGSLTILEMMYPMLQGYDSVAINSDVEFGGTDQKFNNLAGRELMQQMGMTPQDILLVPLIPGTDGRKMGKSFNNTIDIVTPPAEMFGRVMSVSDDVMPLYFEVLTDFPIDAAMNIVDLMVTAGLASSKGEARRLIDGGGVRVEGEKIEGYDTSVGTERPVVVQVGRRKFA